MSLISEINQAKPPFMTEQQQQRDDSACAVDLSESSLPESNSNSEVFTTTISSAEPESGFAGFGFSEALLRTLADKGYSEPSPIQKAAFPELITAELEASGCPEPTVIPRQAWPVALSGRDMVGLASTGSGQTL